MNHLLHMLAVLLAISGLGSSAWAVQPDEILSNPAYEQRARAISANLRCLVCQNQSIDDSDAPLAADLRVLVRERLTAGDSDGQVVDFIVARYGEFVLLKPRLSAATYLLWGGPLIVLLFAGVALCRAYGRRHDGGAVTVKAALSREEKRKLKKLINDI